MGKSSKSSAPSASSIAGAQTTLNDVNQNTPFGSLTYHQTGMVNGVPQMTADVTLNPQQQALLNGQMAQNQSLLGPENDLISQIGKGAQPSQQDLTNAFGQQQRAAYNSQMSYLQPQEQQQTQTLTDQLAQKGITQQSNPTAYANAMQLNSNQQNFANQLAFNNSYQSGLAGQNQLFNQGVTQSNLPINQLSALRSSNQVTMPSFGSTPTAANGYSNAAQNAYASGLASSNNASSGLMNLGGTLGSAFMNNGGMNWLSGLFGG